MPLSPDQTLNNRYRITALIGQGGMGAVYDGFDSNLSIRVAIKENLLITDASRRQFEREAHVLAGLRHSNLPSVIDHFYIEGQGQYLVMSFIQGEDLKERLQRLGPLPEADVVRWADEVLSALAYLHKREVIHRDIKPNNIKITPQGEAVLVDFGLAKEIVDQAGMTTTGARGLTPGFAPPEQYGVGQGRTDARSDIYAFGATLYVLLTGEASADALSRLTNPGKYLPLSRHPIKVSKALAQTIDKALEMEPEKRFQSVEEMQRGLKTPLPTPKPKPVKPNPPNDNLPTADITNVGGTKPIRQWRNLFILLASLVAIGLVGLLTVAAIVLVIGLGRGASAAATTTPEPTATKRVATATVEATNAVVPSKTSVLPTLTQTVVRLTEIPTASSSPTSKSSPTFTPTSASTRSPTSSSVSTAGQSISPAVLSVQSPYSQTVDASIHSARVTALDSSSIKIAFNYTCPLVPQTGCNGPGGPVVNALLWSGEGSLPCGSLWGQAYKGGLGDISDGSGWLIFSWVGCASGTYTYKIHAIRLSFGSAPYWATGGPGVAGEAYPTDLVFAYDVTFTLSVP